MAEPNEPSRPSPSVRQPVLLGLFAGTAVGGGYLLAGVPNVEVMSLVTALAGVVLGPVRGFAAGALAAAVYSLGSPYGLPAPLLLLAQMAGLGSAGPLGHLAMRRISMPRREPASPPADDIPALKPGQRAARAAAAGLAVTVVHDALTNLAIVGMLDLPARVVLAGALPFFLIHAASNLVIFGSLLPALTVRLGALARPRVTGRPGSLVAATGIGLGLALALSSAPVGARTDPEPNGAATTRADSLELDPARQAPAASAPAAAPDSALAPAAAAPPPAAAGGPLGWRRPLWEPFATSFLNWADRDSPWLTWVDGGVGAAARLSGEGGTSSMPLVVRDGVPLGTGHALADDPWLVGIEGVAAAGGGLGLDGWGGTDGAVRLTTKDEDPERTASSYRGLKGRHESYYRGVDFLSPRADWRLGFTFEETLDNEGYNHTRLDDESFALRRDGGLTGQGKVRQSRTRLMRTFADGNELEIEIGSGRRTRDDLPALGAGSLEAWDRSASVRMRWLAGDWDVRPVLFAADRDIQWGQRWSDGTPPADLRLVESGRQGLRLDIRRRAAASAALPDSGAAADSSAAGGVAMPAEAARGDGAAAPDGLPLLSVTALGWTLRDSGTDAAWAAADTGRIVGRGTELRVALGREGKWAGAHARAQLGVLGGGGFGLGPDVAVGLWQRPLDPRWRLALEWGGRAPRSDEQLTPLRRVVAGRELALLPSAGLEREKTVRAAMDASTRALGLDLAVSTSVRRLDGGIAWRVDESDPDRGRWANDLELTAWRVTTSLARSGRFLGWLRAAAEGTWQGCDVTGGPDGSGPPARWQRLRLDWENHLFQEDGIVQVSLLTTRRSEGADPWDVTGTARLPERTNHDLLLGFRLVGAHLVVGVRNLTNQRQVLTSGALSPGMETDLRLEWGFRQ